MTKLSTIIIEDERPAQEVLRSYIAKTDWLELCAVFEDALTAMEYLKRHEVDLLFLDIQIPSLSGIELLRVLRRAPQTIITTAYSDYALEAFELDVRDYLKKPFSFERFMKAIGRISRTPEPAQIHTLQQKPATPDGFAFFNVNKTMVRIYFKDIRYIESMREYIYIHTPKGKISTKMGISEIEKMLGNDFIRIHRSFIVNKLKVSALNAEDVFVDETPVPIGASYKRNIDEVFRKHFAT